MAEFTLTYPIIYFRLSKSVFSFPTLENINIINNINFSKQINTSTNADRSTDAVGFLFRNYRVIGCLNCNEYMILSCKALAEYCNQLG
jgi:hypothetical protein